MKLPPLSNLLISCCIFSAVTINAAAPPAKKAYVAAGVTDGNVYFVDLTTGISSLVSTSPIIYLNGIALADDQTAYIPQSRPENIYRVDLVSGAVSLAVSDVGGDPMNVALTDIALVNPTTAYMGAYRKTNVYMANLATGSWALVTPTEIGTPLNGIILANSTTAYLAGYTDNNIYKVDLITGNSTLITPDPVGAPGNPGLYGMAQASYTTAYVAGGDSNVYFINLSTGSSSLVTNTPVGEAGLWGIAMANPTTAYVSGLDSNVYLIDLTTGNSTLITPNPVSDFGLYGIAVIPQIATDGLTGNNLQLANYLNDHATLDELNLFYLQNNLKAALESAIPTRNALLTYASQLAQIALGKIVEDHLAQSRWQNRKQETRLAAHRDAESLIASNEIIAVKKSTSPKEFSLWLGALGEFAHEKSQCQTPAFHTNSGGIIAACDVQRTGSFCLGGGIALADTHIHENNNAGHGNVKQGYCLGYATFLPADWMIEAGLWGGYYHAHNIREVSLLDFPGFASDATLKTHGWQFAPHLGIGYDIKRNWLGIEPFAMADWVNCWESGAQEKGADPLNMGQKGRYASLLRSETGLRLLQTLSYSWGAVTFWEKASYAYQKTFHTGRITAFLIGSPSSFTVSTFIGAQNLGVAELAVRITPSNKKIPYVNLNYQGEWGSLYQSNQGNASIGWHF